MGKALRGALALLAILALSGSVSPAISVAPAAGDGETVAVPGAIPSDERPILSPADDSGDGPDRPPVRTAESVADEAMPQGENTISLTQQFQRLPEEPGTVQVTLVYTVPDRVVTLETDIPTEAILSRSNGFERRNDTRFRWTGTSQRASLTYELSVNETVDRTDPLSQSGRYVSVDTNDWSLFERPTTATNWEARGRTPIAVDRRRSTAGPGSAGQWLVFLGEYERHERTAHGQQFELIVPTAADMQEQPAAVLDAMANSSDGLRVGDRDDRVFLVAAPTGTVKWGVRGVQTGDTDIWVRDDERLDQVDSAWIHEYVHSRQSFALTGRTLWFEEASASYYAALLSLEQDAIDFDAFDERMRAGTGPVNDAVVLSNRSTWQEHPDYTKGALVAGQLDRRLRVESDRERTLQDVFRELNGQRRPITQLDFLETLAAAGGTGVLDVGQTYTETPANVTTWNRTTHAAVFGQLPARVGYELPPVGEAGAYRIGGEYRSATVGAGEPIVLVTGERLTVDTIVNNAGGTAGQYNLSLRVNRTAVNETSGRIGASQSTRVALSHRFPTPGNYVVGIDGESINVTVKRPASARVVSLVVDNAQAQQGDSVTLTATVRNDATLPGKVTVVFTRDFEGVGRVRMSVPANGTASVTRQVGLPRSGTVSLGAGSAQSVEISVESVPAQTRSGGTATPATTATASPTPAGSPAAGSGTATTAADGAGFGVVAVLLALAILCFRCTCQRDP